MRFLVDESTGPAVAEWLVGQGHDVFSVFDFARGSEDDAIVQKAYAHQLPEQFVVATERGVRFAKA